jgi:energy-converting hydrogenase Eha subunit A
MVRIPKFVGYFAIVGGLVMIVAGTISFLLVQRELKDEKITVADDAESFAGEPVEGPFTAYSQAMIIKVHALESADGLTFAQLDREDPRRASVQSSSFLRSSLFTSVLAFGVAVLVIGWGLLSILLGLALLALDRRTAAVAPARVETAAAA